MLLASKGPLPLNGARRSIARPHVFRPCGVACRETRRSANGSASSSATIVEPETVHPEIGEVLFTPAELHACCQRLGRQIGADYEDKDVVAIGVVKGGFMFLADLVRQIKPLPRSLQVDFFKCSSYGVATQSSGTVRLDDGFDLATVTDKHVLLVEDIVDTGLTMTAVLELLTEAGALSVKIVTLLDKKVRRRTPLAADYVGFTVNDVFVVGYGIDYAEKYRYLPYVGVPRPEFIQSAH